jgi:hypothetical protein
MVKNILLFSAAFLAVAYQFLHPGFYHKFVQDAVYTPGYIMQFVESFRQGIIYPRWMAESFWGYGSPAFVYYSPLLYFFSSALAFAGLGLAFSITLLKLLCLYVGGLYVFLLVRERHGGRAAAIAALLYMLLPTRLVDLYYINTPAGRFAEVFMPMTLYYAGRLAGGPASRGDLAKMGLSYSGLILSHIASAYLFTPFIVVYGLFAAGKRPDLRTALRVAAGLLAGVCLSGFFFIPVLLERGEIRLELLGKSLPFMREFIFNFTGETDIGAAPFWAIMRNSMVLETTMLVLVLLLVKRRRDIRLDREATLFLFFVALCLFMMSSLSASLWSHIPGMASVALSFRFGTAYLIFISALLGLLLDRLVESMPRSGVSYLAAAVLVLTIAAYDVMLVYKAGAPVSERDAWSNTDQAEMVEYLPGAVKELSGLNRDDPRLSSGEVFTYRIDKWGYVDRAFAVDSPRGARLRVKTFYFPGWRAWVDGKEAPLKAQEGTGAILLDVRPGKHDVRLKFTDTPPRTAGKMLSILTLTGLLIMYFLSDAKEGGVPTAYRG